VQFAGKHVSIVYNYLLIYRAARKSAQRERSACDVNISDAESDVISVTGQSAADYVVARPVRDDVG